MKLRHVALIATAAGAVGGFVWWRRRRESPLPPVQLGLADGSLRFLEADDPSVAQFDALAADVRSKLTVAR